MAEAELNDTESLKMRKTIVATTFVVIGAGTAGVGAIDLNGSDTLETMTHSILNGVPGQSVACPGTSTLNYIGGGSSTGEQAMLDGKQQIAPMSRFLGSGRVCQSPNPELSEGLAVALDGIAVVGDEENTGGDCRMANSGDVAVADVNGEVGLQCPGNTCPGGVYTLADWRDSLRVLYSGITHGQSAFDLNNCNSDVRHALASDWDALVDGNCEGACTELHHVFRRGDLSGTTDTFLSLLSLPGIGISNGRVTSTPFCNGKVYEDLDPIRRDCVEGEQVCRSDGTLGLLVAIFLPEDLPADVAYDVNPCDEGVFEWVETPFDAPLDLYCPNDDHDRGGVTVTSTFGKCLTPMDTSGNYGCLNTADNIPFGNGAADGRAYNAQLRSGNSTSSDSLVEDAEGRQVTLAAYRIHSTTPLPDSNGNPCQEPSATRQIGCLVQASTCSHGFAGREAAEIQGANGIAINGVEPTVEAIQELLNDPGNTAPTTYRFARKLYFNTLKGFENVSNGNEELNLASCFSDMTYVDPAAEAAGFVALPGGPRCQDFDETQCTGVTTNNDACPNNPPPIPTIE